MQYTYVGRIWGAKAFCDCIIVKVCCCCAIKCGNNSVDARNSAKTLVKKKLQIAQNGTINNDIRIALTPLINPTTNITVWKQLIVILLQLCKELVKLQVYSKIFKFCFCFSEMCSYPCHFVQLKSSAHCHENAGICSELIESGTTSQRLWFRILLEDYFNIVQEMEIKQRPSPIFYRKNFFEKFDFFGETNPAN